MPKSPKNRGSTAKREIKGQKKVQDIQDGAGHSTPNCDTKELTCKSCNTFFCDDQDKLIECERCEKWICLKCSGLTEGQYEAMNDESLGCMLHWFCITCTELAVKAVKTDNDLDEKCKQYMARFKSEIRAELKEEFAKIQTSLEEKLTQEIKTVNSKIDNLNLPKPQVANDDSPRVENMELMMEEMKDREARKLNLIIFNLEESDAVQGEERKNYDHEESRKILSTIGATVPITRPTRLGKRGDGKIGRPLRITVSSVSDQHTVLKAAATLRGHHKYGEVFINKDQTPWEQRQWKKLLEERKRKTEESAAANADVTWVIRKGRVIEARK